MADPDDTDNDDSSDESDDDKEGNQRVKAMKEAVKKAVKKANEKNKPANSDSKVAKPDLYYGERDKFEAWVLQMDLYFRFSKVKEKDQALFAGTFLRGSAEHWAKPFMKAKLANKDDQEVFSSWEKFKGASRTVFGISNEVNKAVRLIQNLRQKQAASEYAAKFQEHAQLTHWDNVALMEMYRRGLKDEVKDELIRYPAYLNDIQQLYAASIEIDDRLYERRMEKKYDGKGRHDIETNNRPNIGKFRPRGNFNKYDNRNRRQEPYYGPQPMELDNTQRNSHQGGGRGRPRGKPTGGKKNFKCYACDKEGHIAKNCPSKNMVSRKEFNNIMRTSDSNKENIAPRDEEQEPEQELEEGEVLAPEEEYEHLDLLFRQLIHRINDGNLRIDLTEFTSRYQQLRSDICSRPDNERELVAQMLHEICEYEEIPESEDESEIDALREHASLNWTACYDNRCQMHLSDKQGSGWFPTEPRRELNIIQFSKYLTPPLTSEKQES
jgi:hypothetical protein